MLNITKEKDGLITVTLEGKLDAVAMEKGLEEFIEVSDDVGGKDGAGQKGKLLYLIGDFDLPTLGAVAVEMRMLPQLFGLIRRFDKAAVVADTPWIRAASEWEGAMIPGLEIKAFARKDEKAARQWLTG